MAYVGEEYAGYCGYIPHIKAYPTYYSPRNILKSHTKDMKRPFGHSFKTFDHRNRGTNPSTPVENKFRSRDNKFW